MNDVPTADLFGIFYVRKLHGLRWESYYRTIDSLRALFDDEKFRKVVHGFYLNISGDFDSVRISYFVDGKESEKSTTLFGEFFTRNGIQEISDHEHPHEIIIATNYGGIGYEQRFRNFLRDYTKIALDLLQRNLLHSRRLFTVYRFRVRQASMPFDEFFEPTFEKYSPYYTSFSNREKKRFFNDLREWIPPYTEWAHMMVNMIVGCDWGGDPHSDPLPIRRINEILTRDSLDFRIPESWNPQSFDA